LLPDEVSYRDTPIHYSLESYCESEILRNLGISITKKSKKSKSKSLQVSL